MRVVFQRVNCAFVETGHHIDDDNYRADIKKGAVVFLGVATSDDEIVADKLAKKLVLLRVFEDDNERMNRSIVDIGGEFLVIPNFTLCGDTSHGRRPEFINAARPEKALPLFEYFCGQVAFYLKEAGSKMHDVKKGVFGADMRVMVENDGPVTLVIDEGGI